MRAPILSHSIDGTDMQAVPFELAERQATLACTSPIGSLRNILDDFGRKNFRLCNANSADHFLFIPDLRNELAQIANSHILATQPSLEILSAESSESFLFAHNLKSALGRVRQNVRGVKVTIPSAEHFRAAENSSRDNHVVISIIWNDALQRFRQRNDQRTSRNRVDEFANPLLG